MISSDTRYHNLLQKYRLYTLQDYDQPSYSANLRHAAILNLVERHIFRAKITYAGLSNSVKMSLTTAELLQVEDFQYGGFDLEL